jgi:hypothetical protein
MDYKRIEAPCLFGPEIKNKADLFRKKIWNNSIPIDMEDIIELKLRMEIIPTKSLQTRFGIDALITSNWQSVYIDYDRYVDERYQNRLRFSLAHEIGHFVLHKEIYSGLSIKNLEDFYRFFRDIPQKQYEYFEVQSNKFANYFLVPRERLFAERDKLVESNNLETIDRNTLNSYLAVPLSKKFGVSEQVVEIALSEINQ